MSTLNVAILGAGGIARDQHIPAWLSVPQARVVAAADPSAEALSLVEQRHGIARLERDYQALLDDKTIDVVDVCVPSALHAEVAVAALAAGKHVLCEKPMSTSRAGAEAILRAYRGRDRKLMIAQNMRFEPSVTRLRGYLARHGIGDVYYGRGQWLRRRRVPAKPGFTERRMSGGGPLYDLGVHLLDLAWWLMDCPLPERVTGAVYDHLARRDDLGGEWGQWNPQTIDVEDFAAGMIRFRGGSMLSLEVSWLAPQKEDEFWRLQLFGKQGGVSWPDCTISGETDRTPWDVSLPHVPNMPKSHHLVIQHFADCVLHDRPVMIPPEQSATIIAILESLYESSRASREVEVRGWET